MGGPNPTPAASLDMSFPPFSIQCTRIKGVMRGVCLFGCPKEKGKGFPILLLFTLSTRVKPDSQSKNSSKSHYLFYTASKEQKLEGGSLAKEGSTGI